MEGYWMVTGGFLEGPGGSSEDFFGLEYGDMERISGGI